jgi:thiosulfate sulfurtransferase
MSGAGFHRTTAEEALRLLFDAHDGDRPYSLFDARDPHAYGHGHFPGALPLGEHAVATWINKLPPTQPVFIYCSQGFSSQTFAKRFADAGFSAVYSIDGGFPALTRALEEARAHALGGTA